MKRRFFLTVLLSPLLVRWFPVTEVAEDFVLEEWWVVNHPTDLLTRFQ